MFGGTRLRVVNSKEKNTFAYINSKYNTSSEQTQCIQFFWREKKIYLWTVCSSSVTEGQIAINPLYRSLMQIEEGAELFVSPCSNIKVLDQLQIVPDSLDDQEILEENAEVLQLRILDQLRVVVQGQKTLVWIYSSMPITFTPDETGVLVNHSQLLVKMDNFAFRSQKNLPSPTKETKKDLVGFNNIGIILDEMICPYQKQLQKQFVGRALVLNESCDVMKVKYNSHLFTVYLHKELVLGCGFDSEIYAETSVILPPVRNENKEDMENSLEEAATYQNVLVEVRALDDKQYYKKGKESYNQNIPTVIITKTLSELLNIGNGRKIKLKFLNNRPDAIEKIEIEIYSKNEHIHENICDKFKDVIVSASEKILINDGIVLRENPLHKNPIKYNITPNRCKYALIDRESLRSISLSVKVSENEEVPNTLRSQDEFEYEMRDYCRNIDTFEAIIKKCKMFLEFEKNREASFGNIMKTKGNVLITGQSGSGKTAISEMISKELSVHTRILHCRSLKGRKDILEIFQKALAICGSRAPSVLICDDVDCLVQRNTEGAAPQDIAYYNRLAHTLKKLLITQKGVSIILTSTSLTTLHAKLKEFDPEPFYTEHIEIKELNESERRKILDHLLHDRVKREFLFDEDDMNRMVMECSGFNVRDIGDYVNRLIFSAVKRKALDGSSDCKVNLIEKIETKSSEDPYDIFTNVGGMESVKQDMTEKIFWPVLYPGLYPSQSCGILLFGPPGMGKTYIGSCLARLSNMSFLSVKGPELLSKYIGQSEKAVRDIFDKADAKRPCILFFDEFDSIAPKRGHDSTGVTDRVVNQFLARLDGAEGGAKGPVIAATSRPDLIDPALLRPGRLDQHVYCGPPDLNDRVDILRKISKTMDLHEDVDLESIASRCEDFSPADLKSLLVTAQLSAVDDYVNEGKMSSEKVVVNADHLENALKETKPSLSKEQLIYYNVIYKRFRGEKVSTEELKALGPQHQRVTLA